MSHCVFFNLILYSSSEKIVYYENNFLQPLLKRFLCNFIIISEGREVFCKYKTLFKIDEESQRNKIPSLVLSHLSSDIPIYIIWGMPIDATNELLSFFSKISSRIIFDSLQSNHISEFSKEIIDFKKNTTVPLGDLTWSSLSLWKEALAKFFNQPEVLKNLFSCNKIEIIFSSRQYLLDMTKAFYLQILIALTMKWVYLNSILNKDNIVINYQNLNRETIEIHLLAKQEEHVTPSTPISVEIFLRNSLETYFFQRIISNKQEFLEEKCLLNSGRCFTIGNSDDTAIFQEIFSSSGDSVLLTLLQFVFSMDLK